MGGGHWGMAGSEGRGMKEGTLRRQDRRPLGRPVAVRSLAFAVAATVVLLLAQAGSSSIPAGFTCGGPVTEISNWGVGGVAGGGTAATLTTGRAWVCIKSAATYHIDASSGATG